MQRSPGTATRAHAVSRPPTRRWRHGAAQPRHDRPHARPHGEYLQESARNGEWPTVDVEDGFRVGKLHDAVPRAAPQRARRPGPQPGPLLYLVHARPPERSWPAAAPRALPPPDPVPPREHVAVHHRAAVPQNTVTRDTTAVLMCEEVVERLLNVFVLPINPDQRRAHPTRRGRPRCSAGSAMSAASRAAAPGADRSDTRRSDRPSCPAAAGPWRGDAQRSSGAAV